MPNVLVRDIADEVLEKLKNRASENGRSLQSEVKIILKDAAEASPLSELEVARKIRAALKVKRQSADSTEPLREDRMR